MQKHIKYNQIIRTTLIAILTIALFSTNANAQRRTNTVENEKSKRVEQKSPRYAVNKETKNKRAYRQHAVKPRTKSEHHNKYANKHNKKNNTYYNSDKHYNKYKKRHHSDWYGTYYSKKKNNHYRHNDVHIKVRSNFHPHFDIRLNPIVFRKVPRKAIWVNIEGENYLLHRNKFYHSSPYGFYRVYLPTHIKYLPEGCQELWVNGQQVFRLHGIHFLSTPFGFKVIV